MAAIQVSRRVRRALEARWAEQFNGYLAAVCLEYEIYAPAYQINFTEVPEQPQNFYRGNWTLDALQSLREPVLPVMSMWVGEGAMYGPGQRQMPCAFSGFVVAHWRFFLSIKGRSSAKLADLREATESAMMATLQAEFSEMTYRGDLAWQALQEQIWVDQDQHHLGFVQELEFQASFEV